jgi:CRISPR-associated protein Csx10
MRGALVARHLRRHPTPDLAGEEEARRRFLNGETRFLHAYIADDTGGRTLPTPRAWQTQKRRPAPIYDLSVEPDPDPVLPADELWQPEPLEDPFCYVNDDSVTLYRPEIEVRVHTQRDRVMGRATAEEGAIFRYEALAAGQTFVGAILGEEADLALFKAWLDEDPAILLGGSRSAGYGLTTVVKSAVGEWDEVPAWDTGGPDAIAAGGTLTVTLLSDALLRDAQGRYTAALQPAHLASLLDGPDALHLTPARTYATTGIVSGFNRKWGLPLPQTPVAKAGSVYTFVTPEAIPAARLRDLEATGIGGRRAEGFGRLVCNWHHAYPELQRQASASTPSSPPVALQAEASKSDAPEASEAVAIARLMAGRMLRQRLDRAVRAYANAHPIQGSIHNTQLSQIRVLVRSALTDPEAEGLQQRLDAMQATAAAQFREAQVAGQSLEVWLKDLLTISPEALWQKLFNMTFDEKALRGNQLPMVGDVAAAWEDDAALVREIALRLIDAVIGHELDRRRTDHA